MKTVLIVDDNKDMRFLLIGPLWVIAHIYEAMGVSTDVRTAQGD